MSMLFNRRVACLLLLGLLIPVSALAADAKAVVAKAKDSYYSLRTQGLKGFSCDVTLDWQKLLESTDKKPVAKDDPRLQKYGKLRFTLALDENGQSTVTPYMLDGGEIDASVDPVISGFKQMMSGFYHTWWSLVFINPFLRPSGDMTLRQEGDNIRLLGKVVAADVEILLDKDYIIT